MPDQADQAARTRLARVRLLESRDAVLARQTVSREMKARGASAIRVTRFATAVSEIARNAILHGGGGEMSVFLDPGEPYLVVECRDSGPGIEDLDQAMTDGYTSGGGLGRGLGGAKRLADMFEIRPAANGGTVVTLKARL